MARLAPLGTAVNALLIHLGFKLLSVRILVTSRTAQIREVIRNNLSRLPIHAGRVTFIAQNRHVCSLEREAALCMKCDRERGRAEAFHSVAAFALSVVRCSSELSAVLVLMAIGAFCEGDFVARGLACGCMALVAR